jgi:hypothetical protein
MEPKKDLAVNRAVNLGVAHRCPASYNQPMPRKSANVVVTGGRKARFTYASRTEAGIKFQKAGTASVILVKVNGAAKRKAGHRAAGGFLASPRLGDRLTKAFAAAVARARHGQS